MVVLWLLPRQGTWIPFRAAKGIQVPYGDQPGPMHDTDSDHTRTAAPDSRSTTAGAENHMLFIDEPGRAFPTAQ